MRQALLLALLFSVAVPVVAQKKHKPPEEARSEEQRPASDAHSFTELFGKLERDWGLAAEKKEKSVDEIMADEFIERDATDPENVITRTKWMQERLSDYTLDPLQIRSMTIRAFLGNAVVSFVQKEKATQNGAGRSAEYFIVDVWVANHGKWQVASRFSSVVSQTGVGRP